MFAIIQTGGKQYKVKHGDVLKIEKIEGEKDTKIRFPDVLLVSSDDGKDIKIGNPKVTGASVSAVILNHGKRKKIHVIKYKPKTRYHRNVGHRQLYTEVRILDIKA